MTDIEIEVQRLREALVIHPGDHILVRCGTGVLTAEDAERIKRMLQDRFPANGVTIISADQIAVVRCAEQESDQ